MSSSQNSDRRSRLRRSPKRVRYCLDRWVCRRYTISRTMCCAKGTRAQVVPALVHRSADAATHLRIDGYVRVDAHERFVCAAYPC
jgi:hypothetical protein